MKSPISDDAKNATTQCRKGFACLKEDGTPRCRVKECVNNAVYFLECQNDMGCPYAKSFGNAYHCTCPIRKEFYNKHKK